MKLLLYSDFVCPFCYIAEQSSLKKLQKEFEIEVDWRGFELHPEIPVGGQMVTDIYPKEKMDSMKEYIKKFAASFGVEITFSNRMSNTRRALAMAEYARDHDKLELFRNTAMIAYWKEGKDIEDTKNLYEIAESANLDGQEALDASEDSKYLNRIDKIRYEANYNGISGIPTFIFNKKSIIEGCQPYEELRKAVIEQEDQ